jgi:hypothetical protein
MLTVLHPEILPLIRNVPVGLIPLWNLNGRIVLVIKAPVEILLAARMNQGFRLYVAPVSMPNGCTIGLISAFFDDADEPLIISTPMFDNDPNTIKLRRVFLNSKISLYFFGLQNREMMGYEANVHSPPATLKLLIKSSLQAYEIETIGLYLNEISSWFRLRKLTDDPAAISFKFEKKLMPNNLVHIDVKIDARSELGDGSYKIDYSQLIRENPGAFQEHDIALMLKRVFPQSEIYQGPLRISDNKEIADIVVITASHVIYVQAKDSPNTEEGLNNSMSRKKATALKSLTEAAAQIAGAIRYANSSSPMRMLVGARTVEVPLAGLLQRALIVVKELFQDEYRHYSKVVLENVARTQVPCIALDFGELHQFTSHLSGEDEFFRVYDEVYFRGKQTGVLPRLRFTQLAI